MITSKNLILPTRLPLISRDPLASLKKRTSGGGSPPALDPNTVFDAALWTGDGVARSIVTGIDMTESLLWIKARSTTAQGVIFDTPRGANFYWSPTSTAGSASLASSVTAFNNNGFSLGTQANVNGAGVNYVGWSFKKAPKFFDVQSYTGNGAVREIAHNLNCEPGLIIVKRRDSAGSAAIYHRKSGANAGAQYTLINNTAAPTVNNDTFGGVAATASVFTLGTSATVNAAGGTYVVYLFAHDPSADGIIQCDSYIGNGGGTLPEVNLNWRPQYLYIRRVDGAGNHVVFDSARGAPVGNDSQLVWNDIVAEGIADFVDFLDTGFKINSLSTVYNAAGGVYSYMAIKA